MPLPIPTWVMPLPKWVMPLPTSGFFHYPNFYAIRAISRNLKKMFFKNAYRSNPERGESILNAVILPTIPEHTAFEFAFVGPYLNQNINEVEKKRQTVFQCFKHSISLGRFWIRYARMMLRDRRPCSLSLSVR